MQIRHQAGATLNKNWSLCSFIVQILLTNGCSAHFLRENLATDGCAGKLEFMTHASTFDEMLNTPDQVRDPYKVYYDWFANEDLKRLRRKSEDAEAFFRRIGITFNVYGQDEADERLIPFDIVPRIISAREWAKLEKGIEQRVRAINAFLYDIYHGQESCVPDGSHVS